MPKFFARLIITAVAVLLASNLFGDLIQADQLSSSVLFALILGILNAFLRPILLLLALPLNLLTLGLFTLVINAVIFWVASTFPVGVHVNGFGGAFVGALTVGVVSFIASRVIN